MNRKIAKITMLVIVFLMLAMAFSYSATDAASLNITTDKDKIGKGEEVVVKISTDKKIQTTTFYLNYDSKTMKFVESNTSNVSVKDFTSDGTLRVAYADASSQGTRDLEFKFKAKDGEDVKKTADLEISNFTLKFVKDSKTYKMGNLDDSTFKTTIKIEKPFVLTMKMILPIAIAVVIAIVVIIIKTVFRRSLFKWRRSM